MFMFYFPQKGVFFRENMILEIIKSNCKTFCVCVLIVVIYCIDCHLHKLLLDYLLTFLYMFG